MNTSNPFPVVSLPGAAMLASYAFIVALLVLL